MLLRKEMNMRLKRILSSILAGAIAATSVMITGLFGGGVSAASGGNDAKITVACSTTSSAIGIWWEDYDETYDLTQNGTYKLEYKNNKDYDDTFVSTSEKKSMCNLFLKSNNPINNTNIKITTIEVDGETRLTLNRTFSYDWYNDENQYEYSIKLSEEELSQIGNVPKGSTFKINIDVIADYYAVDVLYTTETPLDPKWGFGPILALTEADVTFAGWIPSAAFDISRFVEGTKLRLGFKTEKVAIELYSETSFDDGGEDPNKVSYKIDTIYDIKPIGEYAYLTYEELSKKLLAKGKSLSDVKALVICSNSDISSKITEISFLIPKIKETAPASSIDYINEMLTELSNNGLYKIRTASDGDYIDKTSKIDGTLPIEDEFFGKTISIVKRPQNIFYSESEAQTLAIPARPVLDITLSATQTSSDGAADGTITISGTYEASKLEYKTDTDTAWSDVTVDSDGTMSGLAAGTYEVRLKATDTAFSSASESITIAEAGAPIITISTQPVAITDVTATEITGNLSVTATATEEAELTYQWFSNTTNAIAGGTESEGATSANFVIPTDLEPGTYYYYCKITATAAKTAVSNTTVARVNVAVKKYTVTYNTNGGGAVASVQAERGAKITAPAVPTKTGYNFVNWCKDEALTTAWDFATATVTSDTTLYANWKIKEYTVKYSSNGGSKINDVKANHGALITAPTAPTRKNYIFVNWYKESSFKTVWNFATDTVTGDVTLYAKWDKDPQSVVTDPDAEDYNIEVLLDKDITVTGWGGYEPAIALTKGGVNFDWFNSVKAFDFTKITAGTMFRVKFDGILKVELFDELKFDSETEKHMVGALYDNKWDIVPDGDYSYVTYDRLANYLMLNEKNVKVSFSDIKAMMFSANGSDLTISEIAFLTPKQDKDKEEEVVVEVMDEEKFSEALETGTLELGTGEATGIDSNMLSALKDSNLEVFVVKLSSGAVIEIDVKTIEVAENFKVDLNMVVTKDLNAAAKDIYNKIEMPSDYLVIEPAHNGAFGFTLRIKLEPAFLESFGEGFNIMSGAYLYHIDKNGNVKEMVVPSASAGGEKTPPYFEEDENGVWLVINGASSYIVTAEKLVYSNTYKISFNANNGTGRMANIENIEEGTDKQLSKNTLTRAGYTFKGWATSANGAKVYDDEATITNITADITLYAVWEEEAEEGGDYNLGYVVVPGAVVKDAEEADDTSSEPEDTNPQEANSYDDEDVYEDGGDDEVYDDGDFDNNTTGGSSDFADGDETDGASNDGKEANPKTGVGLTAALAGFSVSAITAVATGKKKKR